MRHGHLDRPLGFVMFVVMSKEHVRSSARCQDHARNYSAELTGSVAFSHLAKVLASLRDKREGGECVANGEDELGLG